MAVYFASATPVEKFQSRIKKERDINPIFVKAVRQNTNQQASLGLKPINNAQAQMPEAATVLGATQYGSGQPGILREIQGIGEAADEKMRVTVNSFNLKQASEMRRRALENARMQAQSRGTATGQTFSFQGQTNPFFGNRSQSFMGGGDLSRLGLDNEQQRNANTIINIGRQRGLGQQDITIGIMTALAESGLRNVNYGDRDSLGLFQQRPSQGWGSAAQVSNPYYSTNKFYDALRSTRRGSTPWLTAQSVQRSAFADGSNYRAQFNLASRIVTAANTPGSSQTKTAAAGWISQNEWKTHDFDGWYGAQCVDLFNFYNRGFVGGNFIGGVSGAKDIWGNPAMNKNYAALSSRSRAQMGDVVVYGSGWGGGWGHVGIVVSDLGGSLRVLNANATSAGSRGPTVISTLSKSGMLGYYRPRRLM